jgi:hypothetical protein
MSPCVTPVYSSIAHKMVPVSLFLLNFDLTFYKHFKLNIINSVCENLTFRRVLLIIFTLNSICISLLLVCQSRELVSSIYTLRLQVFTASSMKF